MPAQSSISVRQLATKLGVSVATVSRALNNHPEVSSDTRARVLAMADQTGYMPRVGQRLADVIALVYPDNPVTTSPCSFDTAVLGGILDGLNELSFDVTIINLRRDRAQGESFTQFFRRKGVRGVIVRSIEPDSTWYEGIAEEGFPAVLVADRSDNPKVNYIYTDSMQPSVRAIEHLIHLGHKRIALGLHEVLDSDHRDRRDGYLEALQRNGIEHDPEIVFSAGASIEGGARIVRDLLEVEDRPTAIYLTDPLNAVGALHACLERGLRVPQDLSIVGFDDSDIRQLTFPQCTVVYQDAALLGREAARWLTQTLKGTRKSRLREQLPGGFAKSQTTGVCPTTPKTQARAANA